MKNIILILIFIFSISLLFSDNTTDIIENNKYKNYLEILEYGIEDEIVSFVKILGSKPRNDLYPLLLNRYKEFLLNNTKNSMIDFFSSCENLPQNIVDYLYEEALTEPLDIQFYTSLLTFLGKKGQLREGLFLIEKLDSENKMISLSSADALSKMTNKELIEPLLNRLKLSDESDDKYLSDDIKSKIILSFGEMNAAGTVDYLKNKVEDVTTNKFIIMYSMVSLAKIHDLGSLKIIEKKLGHTEVKIQEYAAYALSLYKTGEIIPILKNMLKHNNENIRIYACQGVVLNKTYDANKILLYKYKNDPSSTVKKEALKSLIALGDAGIRLLKDYTGQKKITPADLFVISEMTAKEPNDSNVQYLEELYDKADDNEKETITRGLTNCKYKKLDSLLKKILYSENYLLRLGALKIIFNIKDSSLWTEIENISKNDKTDIVKNSAKKYLELR